MSIKTEIWGKSPEGKDVRRFLPGRSPVLRGSSFAVFRGRFRGVRGFISGGCGKWIILRACGKRGDKNDQDRKQDAERILHGSPIPFYRV